MYKLKIALSHQADHELTHKINHRSSVFNIQVFKTYEKVTRLSIIIFLGLVILQVRSRDSPRCHILVLRNPTSTPHWPWFPLEELPIWTPFHHETTRHNARSMSTYALQLGHLLQRRCLWIHPPTGCWFSPFLKEVKLVRLIASCASFLLLG